MSQIGPDFATNKPVNLAAPEEIVRQEYERVLVESYSYPKCDLDIEVKIPRGQNYFPDRADIVIYANKHGRDPAQDIIGIVETKKRNKKGGLAQIKSYMTATSAIWGVWTNGDNIAYLYRQGTKIRDDYLNNIPAKGQSVEEVGRLNKADLKPFNRSELKSAFRRILNTLYANTNIGRREKLGSEMIKIIFAKLEDERTYADSPPEFRAEAGERPSKIAKRVKSLFSRVREELKDDGIFSPHENITLDNKSIAWVVGQLERGSLINTESDVVGDAFEIFSESKFIGEKGEFFTPRGVVQIAVKIVNPKPDESICDPACGSGGFLIHTMKHIWEKMAKSPKWKGAPDIKEQQKNMAKRSIFGVDKETDLVKIAKAHMAIAGDGRSNIVHENSLHNAIEFEGEAAIHFVTDGEFREFDAVLTNPPFGTKTKVLANDARDFKLGRKWKLVGNEWMPGHTPTDRDPYVLFVERCLELLKKGGTLAIILPETVFHAPTLGYLRQFILNGNNVKAVVDLPHNTFRPYCNAKTCLLVIQKGKRQQTKILMATPEEMGHDHTGRALYRPDTDELWDDLSEVLKEIDVPHAQKNKHVFSVPWTEIDQNILVPRFYKDKINLSEIPNKQYGISLGDLFEEGVIGAWDGHGSPESQAKGQGSIPYIRVSDIVNWELYRNPVSGIPVEVYKKIKGDGIEPKRGDVIFVRRGSYRIGTVAMASSRDREVLLTKELLTFRVIKSKNKYGLDPFYLLAMLSSSIVQRQIENLVFVDTTLPNIGDRWKHLIIPFHKNRKTINKISSDTQKVMSQKWSAQTKIDNLRKKIGGIVT